MSQRHCIAVFLLFLTLLLAIQPGTVMAQGGDQRTADYQRAAKLFSTYYSDLNSSYAFSGHEAEYLETWAGWKEEVQQFLPEFQERYGTTIEEVEAKFEGVDPPAGVGNSIVQICRDLYAFDFAQKEKEIAGWAAAAGDEAYRKWENFTEPDDSKMELKVDYAQRALTHYERAAAIDAGGDYAAQIDQAQGAIAESKKAWMAVLEKLEWPGNNPDFAGPGNPKDLAREAMKLLQSVDSWSKPEYDDEHIPVSICVTGKGWEVSKQNPITRQPTQFSLDFFAAFAGTQDEDIAYAYHMVFYTAEEEGVKKEPPFRYLNSRQYAKHKMLMANVPQMVDAKDAVKAATRAREGGDAAGGDDRPGPSGTFFGVVLRLLLAVILVAAGIACAAEFFKIKVPALAGLATSLVGAQRTIGLAALLIGLLAFLRVTFFYLNPLADLVPQALAVLGGLVLAGSALPAGLGDRLQGLVKALSGNTQNLGLVAVLFGILHLLLAQLWLL